MKKKFLKKFGIFAMFGLFGILSLSPVYGQGEPNNDGGGSQTESQTENDLEVDGFNIMPKLDDTQIQNIDKKIEDIGSKGGKVLERYNKEATTLTTSEQVASGIMNRDTVMNYLVFIVQFLSQLGLVVGAVFIMYAGYKYIVSVFNGGKGATPDAIKNAIIGIFIVIFSYAIMRILTSFIGLT